MIEIYVILSFNKYRVFQGIDLLLWHIDHGLWQGRFCFSILNGSLHATADTLKMPPPAPSVLLVKYTYFLPSSWYDAVFWI